MAKFQSRHFVIDASIAQAAGEFSMHPVSRSCRIFLEDVRDLRHKVFVTISIKLEWDRHQSGFSRGWRQVMLSRKQWVPGVADENAVARRLPDHVDDPEDLAEMVKDCLLIEAALASDRRVASLDEKSRALFRSVSQKLRDVGEICWVNPADDDSVPGWLREGAPAAKSRKLRYFTPKSVD